MNYRKDLLAMFAILIAGTLAATSASADIIHVDAGATGDNDGVSWEHAFTDLQVALAGAGDGDEIRAAAGVYTPGSNQTDTFHLINGVAIYGGFPPGGGEWEDRDWATHETILSGDINGSGNLVGNSYHVVTGSNTDLTAVLDGFTITGGHANDEPGGYAGGGIHNGENGSPQLTNLVITGNAASDPGGFGGFGGGMLNRAGSAPVVTNVIFRGNSAGFGGGGMANDNSSPTLVNVSFRENTAHGTFGSGGGMANVFGSNPTLTNAVFSGNSASANGGGMVNDDNSSATLVNVTFSGNSANLGGAMYNVEYQNPGISGPVLHNVTFSGNSADESGGAIYNLTVNTSPELDNVILWGNSAPSEPEIHNAGSATVTLRHSIVQGGCPAASTCTGVIGADPLLGPLQDNGGFTETMLPGIEGAAIDAGDTGICPDEDQRGVSRPQGDDCDVGAVEWIQADLVVEVSGQGAVDAGSIPEPAGGGIVGCDESGAGQPHCTARYVEGENEGVTLSLAPAEHWHIGGTAGCGGEPDGATFTIAWLNADCTVTVSFAIDQYTLEYSAGSGGSIGGDTSQTVDHGSDGSAVTALPDAGHHFVQWSDGVNDNPRIDTNVTADLSVTAEFAPSVDGIFEDRFQNE